MSIDRNLKALRINAKKSQQEIADLLNIDRKTYAKWENGHEIKSSYIPLIAEIFKLEISDLFTNEKTNPSANSSIIENDSSINTAVIILTDQNIVEKLISVLGDTIKK